MAMTDAETQQLRDAYGRVFAGPIGQQVLIDILLKAQVAHRRGDDLGLEARAFHDGRADMALQILNMVSDDPMAGVLAVVTTNLKGSSHDRSEPEFEPEL